MSQPIEKAVKQSSLAPFLKWAGGKRWLTSSGLPKPNTYRRYIEPFLGGGAVFFHLQPNEAVLSDVNRELIELYQAIRDYPDEFQQLMLEHHLMHSKSYYYKVRAHEPAGQLDRAARTLYLNRTCWNGLYRVNRKGEFNVPIGTKDTVVFEGENFRDISIVLASADIRCSDFEATINLADDGDFLFVDPPYTVQHNNNGFIKYNENIFSWSDQERLRDAIKRALSRGVAVVLTNADHASVRKLYDGVCSYRPVSRASVLSGNPNFRSKTTEALFFGNII